MFTIYRLARHLRALGFGAGGGVGGVGRGVPRNRRLHGRLHLDRGVHGYATFRRCATLGPVPCAIRWDQSHVRYVGTSAMCATLGPVPCALRWDQSHGLGCIL